MGIGRREFLKAFGSIIVAASATPSTAAGTHNDLYVNRRLGIAFRKPPDWTFESVRDMGMMKKAQLLDVDDRAYSDAILGSIDLPFVAASRRSSNPERAGAAVQCYLTSHPSVDNAEAQAFTQLMQHLTGKRGKSPFEPTVVESEPMQKIRHDWQASRGLLKSYRVSSMPRDLILSGCDAAEYTASYLFEHEELACARLVRSRTVFVKHRELFYLFRLIDSEADPFDFDSFLSEVKMV